MFIKHYNRMKIKVIYERFEWIKLYLFWLDIWRKLYKKEVNKDISETLNNMDVIYRDLDRLNEALVNFNKSLGKNHFFICLTFKFCVYVFATLQNRFFSFSFLCVYVFKLKEMYECIYLSSWHLKIVFFLHCVSLYIYKLKGM